jgi:hypothetical protein
MPHETASNRSWSSFLAVVAIGAHMAMDPGTEEMFLGIAHALFVNRLHVLRLTEVVRLGIRPDSEDQNMEVPSDVDRELIQQAFAYVARHFPPAFAGKIEAAKARWVSLA